LTTEELARATRFKFDIDRCRYIAGRGFLRTVLGNYLDAAPAKLELGYGPYGKPYMLDARQSNLIDFNLSHCGNVAVCALSRNEVGIDIERVTMEVDVLALAEQFCTTAEVESLKASPGHQRRTAFFRLWTSKEACAKMLGLGLSVDLRECGISAGPEIWWSVNGTWEKFYLYQLAQQMDCAWAFASRSFVHSVMYVDFQLN
jgi:4'-phosphopantetheinyl transferase